MQAEVSFAAPHTSLLLFHQSFLFKNREGFILLKLWVEWTVQFSNPFPGEMYPLSRNLVLLYGASAHQAEPRPQGFWDQKRSDASISCKGVLNENPTPCLLTSASLQACGDSSEGGKDCWLSHVSAPEAEKQLLRNNSLSLRQVVQPPIAHLYLLHWIFLFDNQDQEERSLSGRWGGIIASFELEGNPEGHLSNSSTINEDTYRSAGTGHPPPLANLCQCFTTLVVKNFTTNLNLPQFEAISLHPITTGLAEESLSPSFLDTKRRKMGCKHMYGHYQRTRVPGDLPDQLMPIPVWQAEISPQLCQHSTQHTHTHTHKSSLTFSLETQSRKGTSCSVLCKHKISCLSSKLCF